MDVLVISWLREEREDFMEDTLIGMKCIPWEEYCIRKLIPNRYDSLSIEKIRPTTGMCITGSELYRNYKQITN